MLLSRTIIIRIFEVYPNVWGKIIRWHLSCVVLSFSTSFLVRSLIKEVFSFYQTVD